MTVLNSGTERPERADVQADRPYLPLAFVAISLLLHGSVLLAARTNPATRPAEPVAELEVTVAAARRPDSFLRAAPARSRTPTQAHAWRISSRSGTGGTDPFDPATAGLPRGAARAREVDPSHSDGLSVPRQVAMANRAERVPAYGSPNGSDYPAAAGTQFQGIGQGFGSSPPQRGIVTYSRTGTFAPHPDPFGGGDSTGRLPGARGFDAGRQRVGAPTGHVSVEGGAAAPGALESGVAVRPSAGSDAATTDRTAMVSPARPRFRTNPLVGYPEEARLQRQAGLVTLKVDVNAQGGVDQVQLEQSCGFPKLDDAAVSAVRRWAFDPARTLAGPVSSQVTLQLRFGLD